MQVCPPGVLFLAASRVSLSKSESKESVTKLGCPSGACVVAALSPLRDCVTSHSLPTACAVGCILAPLRGYLLSLYPTFRMPSQLLHRLLRDLEDFFHSSQRRGAGKSLIAPPGLGIVKTLCHRPGGEWVW